MLYEFREYCSTNKLENIDDQAAMLEINSLAADAIAAQMDPLKMTSFKKFLETLKHKDKLLEPSGTNFFYF